MAYFGFVTKINNVRKDLNSDKLYLGDCFGEGVIVGDNYQTNDMVLYLPQDGQVERWFGDEFNLFRKNKDGTPQGGYLEDNGHIRAIKLRGNQSSGITIKVEDICKKFGNQDWVLGDQVNTINGKEFCRKYIPKRKTPRVQPTSYKGKKMEQVVYPEFSMHADTEQLAYNMDKFNPGDRINITLKMHGTSQRSMMTYAELPKGFFRRLFHMKPKTRAEYVCGTRRCVINKDSQGYYDNNDFRMVHHEALKPYIRPGMEVFYEVVGYYGPNESDTIMPSAENSKINDKAFTKKFGSRTVFSYGCNPGLSKMFIYRITSENGKKEWTPDEITAWCKLHGFDRVPIVDDFIFTTQDDLRDRINKYFEDLVDPIGKTHIKEGVVVRIVNRPIWKAYKEKTFEFKVLSGLAIENVNADEISQDILEEM